MNFLSLMWRFLFWVVVISWSVRLLRQAIGWMLRGSTAAPPGGDKSGASGDGGRVRHLVRDPVCGTYVAEEVSFPLREGSEVVRFCSETCRDAYAEGVRKMAANG